MWSWIVGGGEGDLGSIRWVDKYEQNKQNKLYVILKELIRTLSK